MKRETGQCFNTPKGVQEIVTYARPSGRKPEWEEEFQYPEGCSGDCHLGFVGKLAALIGMLPVFQYPEGCSGDCHQARGGCRLHLHTVSIPRRVFRRLSRALRARSVQRVAGEFQYPEGCSGDCHTVELAPCPHRGAGDVSFNTPKGVQEIVTALLADFSDGIGLQADKRGKGTLFWPPPGKRRRISRASMPFSRIGCAPRGAGILEFRPPFRCRLTAGPRHAGRKLAGSLAARREAADSDCWQASSVAQQASNGPRRHDSGASERVAAPRLRGSAGGVHVQAILEDHTPCTFSITLACRPVNSARRRPFQAPGLPC